MKKNNKQRKARSLERLRFQLKLGSKPQKVDGRTINKTVPLTESDKTRIEKEIAILEGRI